MWRQGSSRPAHRGVARGRVGEDRAITDVIGPARTGEGKHEEREDEFGAHVALE